MHKPLFPTLIGIALACLCPPTAEAATRSWPFDRALDRFAPAADSAWNRGPAEGIAFGDSLLRVARGRRDPLLEAAVHAWRGRKFANAYRLPEGEPDLDTAWTIVSARRDSAGIARVLAARGHGAVVLGRHDEARRQFSNLLPLAQAAGLPELVGFAHRGLGFIAKLNGRYDEASRHLKIAIRLLPADRFENRHARFLLAEVVNRTGAHDKARTMFLDLLDEARLRKDRWLEAAAFNDLGILEYGEGDMARADRYWAYAAGVFDSTGNASSAMSANLNRAYALARLERTSEARALLERLLNLEAQKGPSTGLATILSQLGDVNRQLGRNRQAEELLRAVRAAEQEDVAEQLTASLSLSELLLETGRAPAAEALLDSLLAPEYAARMMADDLVETRAARSRVRRALGRPREAMTDARAAEQLARVGRSKGSIYWLDAAIELGRCHRALGDPDSAVAVLRGAARTWERWRAEISDLEWRERQGSKLAMLFAEYGLALLDGGRRPSAASRAQQAFDALQAFQARTLEERMHGRGLAGRGVASRVSADSLRRGVLREGELLVDLVATPDTTLAFLISRAGVEARLLPGTTRLNRLYTAWREAALSGADEGTVRAGLSRLAAELIAPLAGPIRGSRGLIFTGGGPIALWPLAALTLPGESEPLGTTREVSSAPSATLLATLRSRTPSSSGGSRVLALGRTTDAGGRSLSGAESELRGLSARYAGVELRLNRGERAVADLTGDLARWDVLHFAAHAEAESGTPWRSGFLLGRGTGEDAYLRASGIAGLKLRARLAVLSGCQSAGATTLAGEGALGLASAFLCSGARSVVATLWPVEDRVAQRFMGEFYAALASGRTVAGAVGEAQRALRSRAETSSARDWAAFVASGEGETRIALTRRSLGGSGLARP